MLTFLVFGFFVFYSILASLKLRLLFSALCSFLFFVPLPHFGVFCFLSDFVGVLSSIIGWDSSFLLLILTCEAVILQQKMRRFLRILFWTVVAAVFVSFSVCSLFCEKIEHPSADLVLFSVETKLPFHFAWFELCESSNFRTIDNCWVSSFHYWYEIFSDSMIYCFVISISADEAKTFWSNVHWLKHVETKIRHPDLSISSAFYACSKVY